jgi:hypothetical protein
MQSPAVVPGAEPTYKFATSCSSAASFAYPAHPTGSFLAALQRGTIRISYNANTYDLMPGGKVLADSTQFSAGTPVVLGAAADFLNGVVTRIGAAYNVKYLALTWITCATSDVCFDQLANGVIDILWGNWVMPSSYNSQVPRFYAFNPSPCLTWVTDLAIWVTTTSSYNTAEELLTAYKASPAAFNITAVSGGTRSTAQGFFGSASVINLNSNTPSLFANLNAAPVGITAVVCAETWRHDVCVVMWAWGRGGCMEERLFGGWPLPHHLFSPRVGVFKHCVVGASRRLWAAPLLGLAAPPPQNCSLDPTSSRW